MRELKVSIKKDISSKRFVVIAKWLSRASITFSVAVFVLSSLIIVSIDLSLGKHASDALYIIPVLLACWVFKPLKSILSTIFIVTILAVKYWLFDPDPGLIGLASDVMVHSLVFLILAGTTISFRELFDHVQALAIHDRMTGILNKEAFDDEAASMLERARALGQTLILVVLDLDGFKAVNDRYGHAAGDELLQEFSRQASLLLRRHDCFGRMGGDEFSIVLPVESIGEAGPLAADLHQRISVMLERFGYAVTCSMGALIVPPGVSRSEHDLMSEADDLMYGAKRNGKNTVKAAIAVPDVVAMRNRKTARPTRIAI